MTIRSKLLTACSVIVLLAVAVAVGDNKLIPDSIVLAPQHANVPLLSLSDARAAQLDLANARRAIAEGIMLGDAAPPGVMARIRDAMKQFDADLKIVRERMAGTGADDVIDKAQAAAEACFKLGMSYLEPPAAGVTELPLPIAVMGKADDAVNAVDLVVEAAARLYDGPPLSVSYARAAQLDLADARRAMGEWMMLSDAAPSDSVSRIRDAMQRFDADLKTVRERMAGAGADDAIDQAQAAAGSYFNLGIAYIAPPAGGVTDLPAPFVVLAKAQDAADAIERVVEAASTTAPDMRMALKAAN
jgi:hypothetical protein